MDIDVNISYCAAWIGRNQHHSIATTFNGNIDIITSGSRWKTYPNKRRAQGVLAGFHRIVYDYMSLHESL